MHKVYRIVRGVSQRHIARFPASVRHYITLSDQSAELLKPYLPDRAQFHPLVNIINVEQAGPVDAAASNTLLVVGRLDAEKGVLLAAEAAKRAALPIIFVGDGPLREAVEATGARVTGWLSADGVRAEIDRARCLVFPSMWYETFGLVVTEAAARGVPAIVSDIAAPAERIVDGRNGWIFRSGELEDLMRCIALTRDDGRIRAAGANAYHEYWSNPSSPARHTSELIAIYDRVISDGDRAAGSSRSAA